MNRLPPNHDQRFQLNDEVHARPPDALSAPSRLSFLALLNEGVPRDKEVEPIRELARRFGIKPPEPEANHFSADLGPCRVTWERHTEFTRYSFIEPCEPSEPFSKTALRLIPQDWGDTLPGRTLVAVHVAIAMAGDKAPNLDRIASQYFNDNVLIGATVADGAAIALTDFRIQLDGFSRILLLDQGLAPRQAGRTAQRLLEIDAYRVLALLALPIARDLTPFLARSEAALAEITADMVDAKNADEPALLDRLIRLQAQIESRRSQNFNRFGAAVAYHDLVQRRIDELRESRLPGSQTFKELTDRRLVPAMNTCSAVSARQEALSTRVSQATQLLSTRVDIASEKQNQSLLASMDRRADLQLRLQETVEGLSIAAITYYVVGLVSYLVKGLISAGLPIKYDIATALSIPVVALLVWSALAHVRRRLTAKPMTPTPATTEHSPA
jgi:uncharacterized membrane-anchored protein